MRLGGSKTVVAAGALAVGGAFSYAAFGQDAVVTRVTGIVQSVDNTGLMTLRGDSGRTLARLWANTIQPQDLALLTLGRRLDCRVAYNTDGYSAVSICGFGAANAYAENCELGADLFCLGFPRLDLSISLLGVGERLCSEVDLQHLAEGNYINDPEIDYAYLCQSFEN